MFSFHLGSLGYVPHCDMMQFIAMATSGAYLAQAPPVSILWCLFMEIIYRVTLVVCGQYCALQPSRIFEYFWEVEHYNVWCFL